MPQGYRLAFADDFDGPDLDLGVWVPHYLPAWSSREASRAEERASAFSMDLAMRMVLSRRVSGSAGALSRR